MQNSDSFSNVIETRCSGIHMEPAGHRGRVTRGRDDGKATLGGGKAVLRLLLMSDMWLRTKVYEDRGITLSSFNQRSKSHGEWTCEM